MGPKKEIKKGTDEEESSPKKNKPKTTKKAKPTTTTTASSISAAAPSDEKPKKKNALLKTNEDDEVSVTSSQLFGSTGSFSGENSEEDDNDSDFSGDDEPINKHRRGKPGFVFNNSDDDSSDHLSVDTEEDEEEDEDSVGEYDEDLGVMSDDETPHDKESVSASTIDAAVLATSSSNVGESNLNTVQEDEDGDWDEDNDHAHFLQPAKERDDKYFDELTDKLRQTLISDFHPHLLPHDSTIVSQLSKVVRDEDGEIVDEHHKTFPWLSNLELTRVLGERAEQLDEGALAFVEVPEGVIEGSKIARLELQEGKLPFIMVRPLPSGKVEYWPLSELQLIPTCDINAL
jgi:DNA-directed RNA polymerase subunit K/omega